MQAAHPDKELLILLKQDSYKAFEAIYYRYFETLAKSAFKRIPDESLVEEIVQDVFVNLWNKRNVLDIDGEVKAYLFATLRNKVLHEIRARIIQQKHLSSMLALTDSQKTDSLDELLIAKETEEKINRIIENLPPQCRDAFILSRFENLSYKEIAEKMNISVNTVEKHIGKALKILRNELEGYAGLFIIIPGALLLLKNCLLL